MGFDLADAQRLAVALLNGAVAVAAGALLSSLWLGRDGSDWAVTRRAPLRRSAVAGCALALLAGVCVLWLEAALMAEVPFADAAGATWTMLTSTHFGTAWAIGMLGLAGAAVAVGAAGRRSMDGRAALPAGAGLAVFWYTRSIVGHAGGDGDLSLRVAADWLHLALVSTWVGEVLVAGAVVLGRCAALDIDDRRARATYVSALSRSAAVALAGIFVTGLFASWRALGGWTDLIGNPYGDTLTAKLLLVGVAALLGGVNRWIVMPAWLAAEPVGGPAPHAWPARFRRILWTEALVLLAVLVLAAWLASTAPPGEAASGQL
jgi:putative copper resistance protein D